MKKILFLLILFSNLLAFYIGKNTGNEINNFSDNKYKRHDLVSTRTPSISIASDFVNNDIQSDLYDIKEKSISIGSVEYMYENENIIHDNNGAIESIKKSNLKHLIDKKFIRKVSDKLNSKYSYDRISAISFLAEYGTPESQKIIKNIALSKLDEDADVKAIAIVTADWSGDFNVLTDMLNSGESDINIKTAIINAADLTAIDNTNKEQFNQILLGQLAQEHDDNYIINSLEYLKRQGDFFSQESMSIVASIPNLSNRVAEYLASEQTSHSQ